MTKRRKVQTPPSGRPWPDLIRVRAVALYAELDGRIAEVRKALGREFEFSATAPSRAVIHRWAKIAGLVADGADRDVKGPNARDTSKATEVRLARQAEARTQLSDLLLGGVTVKAAEQIAERLAEEEERKARLAEAEERLDAALAWLEALTPAPDPQSAAEAVDEQLSPLERELRDLSDKALTALRKDARSAVQTARLIVEARRGARLDVRDLVGVLTRGLADHLALEGIGADDELDPSERVIVELAVPTADDKRAQRASIPTASELRARAEADA